MPKRNLEVSPYRFAFNGKERDDEVKGSGNSYDFGARIYDERLGKWWSVDPKFKKYPGISTYNYTFNNPIIFVDPNGKDGRLSIDHEKKTITLETTVFLYGKDADNINTEFLESKLKKFGTERKVLDPETKEIYTVKLNIKFVRAKALDNADEAMSNPDDAQTLDPKLKKEIGFKAGDNLLEIKKINGGEGFVRTAGQATYQGANTGSADPDFGTIFHETFHFLGYDDRYDLINGLPKTHDDFEGDVLSDGTNYKENIHPIHFSDLLDFVIEQGLNGENVLHNDEIDNTERGSQPSSNEEIQQSKNRVKP